MTTIVELPNEPKFTIKTVSTQTGIPPVTLRAWERRHEILFPFRASNRYRLYSERDIAILRWLKYRVDDGVSISNAVSELRQMTSKSIWPDALPQVPTSTQRADGVSPAKHARLLSQALIMRDDNRSSALLREAHAQFDLMTVCMEILVPAARQVDESYFRGEIQVSIKRFAAAYLRGKLLTLLQAYPCRHNAPRILVGCAPMEVNELHSLMLAVLLRSEGYQVEYLGPDIPLEDLADYAMHELPAMVILWAASEFTAREMRRMQSMLKGVRSAPVFGYAGRAFDQRPALRQEIPGAYLGESLRAALNTTQTLIRSRQKSGSRVR